MPMRSTAHAALPPFDLRAAREAKVYTQEECATLLCVTQSTINRWETDGNMPEIYRKYWALYHTKGVTTDAKRVKPVARPKSVG